MSLPFSEKLPTSLLSSVFNKTTATYKFYWLISLVELVEKGKTVISKKELFAKMISNSWYTINYFHLSFGKYDMLPDAIQSILELESLEIDSTKEIIYNKLVLSNKEDTIKLLNHFNTNVPHRFLSPWFPGDGRAEIYKKSKKYENQCLYALEHDDILINPNWLSYLKSNSIVIKDFCYWNLSDFLQKRNPNVTDIPTMLGKAL